MHLDAALVAAVCGAAGGVVRPGAHRAAPGAGARPGAREGAAEEPKEPYADIAALPGLAWKSALASAACAALVGAAVGWQWALVVLVPLVPLSVALAVIDWRTRLLPTRLVLPGDRGGDPARAGRLGGHPRSRRPRPGR